MSLMKKRTITITCAALVAAVVVGYTYDAIRGARSGGAVVTVIVPKDFRGTFRIRFARPGAPSAQVGRGRFMIHVDAAGLADIADKNMFNDWHRIKCRDTTGADIPYANDGVSDISDSEVALRDMGMAQDRSEQWYVIGDFNDLRQANAKRTGMPLELEEKGPKASTRTASPGGAGG
jgi:hypothetical protein